MCRNGEDGVNGGEEINPPCWDSLGHTAAMRKGD